MKKNSLVLLIMTFFSLTLAAGDFEPTADFKVICTIDSAGAFYAWSPAAINSEGNLLALEIRGQKQEPLYNIWNINTGTIETEHRGEISEQLNMSALFGFQGISKQDVVSITFNGRRFTAGAQRDHSSVAIWGEKDQLIAALKEPRGVSQINTLFFFESGKKLHLAVVHRNKTVIWKMCD